MMEKMVSRAGWNTTTENASNEQMGQFYGEIESAKKYPIPWNLVFVSEKILFICIKKKNIFSETKQNQYKSAAAFTSVSGSLQKK